VLKNGDRLSGTIIKSDGKALVIKTDYAGEVTVQFAAIDQITSTQPLHLTLKDGKTVAGPVATADGNVVVATGGSGAVTSPKAEIVTIRDDAEQAAYVKALHPGLTSGWAGGVNVGFALTRGNSETKNLNLAFHALRKTSNDQIKVYLNSVYAPMTLRGRRLQSRRTRFSRAPGMIAISTHARSVMAAETFKPTICRISTCARCWARASVITP